MLLDSKLDCLCLQETFLKDIISDNELQIPGYKLIRHDRHSGSGKNSGGGLLIYTTLKRNFEEIENSHVCTPNIESHWIRLKLTNAHDTYICNMYRPPDGNISDASETLEHQLINLDIPLNADVLFLGDVNIDLLKRNAGKSKLMDFLKSHNYSQLIDKPTRNTLVTASLLDHIYTNNTDLYHRSGVVNPGLSDHALIFTCRKRVKVDKEKENIVIRCYKDFNQADYAMDICNHNWQPVLACMDVDEAVNSFHFEICTIINKHMPFKKIRVRKVTVPWINAEYLSLTDRRTYLCSLFDKCPCMLHQEMKTTIIRECQYMKVNLKRDYVETCINRHGSDPKKLWKTIREFWPNNKSQKSTTGERDPAKLATIANDLNEHFSTVGQRIQAGIPMNVDINEFMPVHHPPIFDLNEVTVDEVCKVIKELKPTATCSVDGITDFMVKSGMNELSPILTHLFNMSIRQKTFPDAWKHATITPLYKSGDHTCSDNYRPISVLPTLGKILECVAHSQCMKYLSDNDLICDNQSGFRPKHSTLTCLTEFLHEIYESVDNGKSCGVVFLDLAKAFDSVDHNILKMKLRCLGFKPAAVSWFTSYLTNRTQCTKVNNKVSNCLSVSHGVPQGSILGPLLFVCYVNDMPKFIDHASTYLYADDTAVMVSDKHVPVIEQKLNSTIEQIYRWFCANKLKVNIKKTKSMLFRSPHRHKDENLLLFFDQEPVEQVPLFKYLGVLLDPHLNFAEHVDHIVRKVNQRTRILWKMRNFISTNMAKMLYTSLIEPPVPILQ